MKYVIGLVLSSLLALPTLAQDSNRASVEALLEATDADSVIDSMYAQMDQMFAGMGQQLGIQPAEMASFENYMNNVSALMKSEMSWEKMREPIIDIYLAHYTEKEIQDMLAFYQSETGRSMVTKMPVVMDESMKLSQQMFADMMPKLQVLAVEFQKELQAIREGQQN